MSETQTKVQELSLLDQFKQQHAQFIHQKELAQANLNQLVGAMHACQIMIDKYEAQELSKNNRTEQLDDKIDSQDEK